MSAAEDLFRQALTLTEEERRRLTRRLAASLSRDAGGEYDAETIAELHRRAAAMESGEDAGVAWSAVRAELAASRAARSGP
jgi:putative addiction module component (TIGR02574 family)